MTDVSGMSTDDLMALYNRQKAAPQAAPASPDLSSMSTEDLMALHAHQQAAPAQDQSGGIVQSINDLGSNIRTGLTHGVAGLIGLPVSAVNAIKTGADYATTKPMEWIGAMSPEAGQMVRDKSYKLPGGITDVDHALFAAQQKAVDIFSPGTDAGPYQPKTEAGKLTQDVTGAMVAPGKTLVKLGAGAGSYVGGLINDNLVPEQYREYAEPALRFLGAVAGGGTAAAPGAIKESSAAVPHSMIREATQGVTPQEFDQAATLQQSGQQIGLPLTSAEALSAGKTNAPVAQLAGDVMASRAGNAAITQPVLADRPNAVRTAVGNWLDQIGPAPEKPSAVSANLESAAGTHLQSLRQERTAAVNPDYQAARTDAVSPQSVMDLVNEIQSIRGNFDPAHGTHKELTSLIDRLWPKDADNKGARLPPITEVPVLDNIYKDIRDKVTALPQDKNSVTTSTKKTLGDANSALGDMLTRESQNLAQGRATYQQMSPNVDQYRTSAAGRMIGANNSDPMGAFNRAKQLLFSKDATPAEIQEAAAILNKQNPDAFRDALRLHLGQQFDAATQDLQPGQNVNLGTNFRNKVYGTDQQKLNLPEALGNAQGGTAQAEPLMSALEATSKIPGTGSPTATRAQTLAQAGNNGMPNLSDLASAVRHPISAGASLALNVLGRVTGMDTIGRQLVAGKNLEEIGRILGAPDSVREIQRISAMPKGAPKTAAAANLLFLAAKQAGQASPQQN